VAVGRNPLPKAVLKEHQRDRVLAAAAGAFATRGYNSTTVDDLIAAAQIGVGSFYSLFSGKQECFLALYDRSVSEARAAIAAAAPPGAPWPDRFCAGLRRLLELAAADPARARVVIVEANTVGPEGEARHARIMAEAALALRGARSVARADGPLPGSFEGATAAGLAWLLHRRLATGDPLRVEDLLPEMTRVVLEAYPA
jgi:AcrR family transcriptional regulator